MPKQQTDGSRSPLTPEQARLLTERLRPIVSRYDQPGEPQSATMVHAFTDLEKSFQTFLDVLLPKLLDPSATTDQLNDTLSDIGEEFRHILYHIRDVKYFGYLFPIAEGDS
jgi:hypothetical protein